VMRRSSCNVVLFNAWGLLMPGAWKLTAGSPYVPGRYVQLMRMPRKAAEGADRRVHSMDKIYFPGRVKPSIPPYPGTGAGAVIRRCPA
jgi:hypothetical protein